MRTLLITSLMLFATVLVAQEITLEDIWKKGTYRQQSVYGLRSMQDGIHYTATDRSEESGTTINKYSYETGEKVSTVLSETELKSMSGDENASIEAYRFSDDEKFLFVSFDVEHIYRHSTIEKYYIVDLQAKSARLLESEGKQRHATFSPDGTKIAYVKGNDIFVQDYKSGNVVQVTNDGKVNNIINGYADWVYEEEFSMSKAFFWSPDGKKIAFYRTDESDVVEYNMQKFTGLYPEDYLFKYPKAGEDNSKVEIRIYDLPTAKTSPLALGTYEYIPRIKWTESTQFLAVMKMPRLQNELEILLVETATLSTKTIYKEISKTYIEISDDLTFFGNNKGFIWKSEKSGYFHLYKYDLAGKNEVALTKGNWEVREFQGYDAANERLYFTASKNRPMDTELYSVSIKGGETKLLSPAQGSTNVAFSQTFKYYIMYHTSANSPNRVSLHSNDGKELRLLEENSGLKETMAAMSLSTVEFFDFKTSEGITLNAWMMKPKNFDAKKKYPVLMFVYGGPGSQTVSNAMSGNYWWHQYLCQQGYMVVSVDNRGTGARGREFRTQTYGQLGNLETKDQIEGARWLAKQAYVDADRIGIWGWSYGGYMSSLCLSKGADVFKAAIAVAPVTNWRFYDSIYTERYMGLPKDNGNGYDDNSPINHVDKMQGKYLLVHGSGDDNVHFQNSVEMIDALIDANVQFDFAMYPDRNHGIYGGNTRYHLFKKMSDFVFTNL